MPRPRAPHPLDAFVQLIAKAVADRIGSFSAKVGGARGGGRRGASKLRGRKLDMRCRYPGCKNKSKGPRFRFLCEEHRRLSKADQNAALEKWAKKHG